MRQQDQQLTPLRFLPCSQRKMIGDVAKVASSSQPAGTPA